MQSYPEWRLICLTVTPNRKLLPESDIGKWNVWVSTRFIEHSSVQCNSVDNSWYHKATALNSTAPDTLWWIIFLFHRTYQKLRQSKSAD